MKMLWTLVLAIGGTLLLLPAASAQSSQSDVNGGWSPWEVDPSIDCCVYGAYARYRRYCTNPTPEGNGAKCKTSNGTVASTEDVWRTCVCGCGNKCGPNSFCVNDSGNTPAYCKCNYPLVRDPSSDMNNITVCINATVVTTTTVISPPATMDPSSKNTKNTVQYVCIVIMLGCLATCFGLMLFCYGFKTLRIIHMNQEITLAATFALIGFLIESTGDKTGCAVVAILVHYLFMCTMTFYCLEALHTYSMVTYVVPVRGYLSALVNIIMGYGIPLVPLAFSVGFLYSSYGNNGRHCWCDINGAGSGQAWGFLFPICFGALACAVIAEAQGQGRYDPLPGTDDVELRSAKISQYTIMINMPLSVAAYVVGLLAVDLQIFSLYMVFLALTVLLGVAIFLSHCATSPRLASMCPCGGRPVSAVSNGRVAPSPGPTPMKMQ